MAGAGGPVLKALLVNTSCLSACADVDRKRAASLGGYRVQDGPSIPCSFQQGPSAEQLTPSTCPVLPCFPGLQHCSSQVALALHAPLVESQVYERWQFLPQILPFSRSPRDVLILWCCSQQVALALHATP